jgi:hypothetical protein
VILNQFSRKKNVIQDRVIVYFWRKDRAINAASKAKRLRVGSKGSESLNAPSLATLAEAIAPRVM